MKKLLLLPFLFLLFSCSENNLLDDNASDNPSLRATSTSDFLSFRTTDVKTISRGSYCIWKYNQEVYNDSYYALAVPHAFYPGAKEQFENSTYLYEEQPFSVFPQASGNLRTKLFRKKIANYGGKLIFRLLTAENGANSKTDAFIGYVNKNNLNTLGTLPLVEYYSYLRSSYEYALDYSPYEEKLKSRKYVRQGIVGYVLPGNNFEGKANILFSFTAEPLNNENLRYRLVVIMNLGGRDESFKVEGMITEYGTGWTIPLTSNSVKSAIIYIVNSATGEETYIGECYKDNINFNGSNSSVKKQIISQKESPFLIEINVKDIS